ncbi:MAG: hypothetical protein KA220_01495 [Phenylobacterium sp.]|mgnify:CR=1 FL=1|jgi:hypothetical protein|nr:hypothetical protein [Phenylobacterium sp.]MBP8247693.1 hypothetical protein [Phenylobacterium sp.]
MNDRHFSARAITEGQQRAFDVMGPDFETAAFEFVERWRPEPDEDGEVEVTVTDTETGERHCFRIDLGSGESEACG